LVSFVLKLNHIELSWCGSVYLASLKKPLKNLNVVKGEIKENKEIKNKIKNWITKEKLHWLYNSETQWSLSSFFSLKK
jgi:hypothetical protein